MNNNYFKVVVLEAPKAMELELVPASEAGEKKEPARWEDCFFFDGWKPERVRAAFEAAWKLRELAEERGASAAVSVFRLPRVSGPWDGTPVIGEPSPEPN